MEMAISMKVINKFMEEEKPADLIALYVLYRKRAVEQGKRIIKCGTEIAAGDLNWGIKRVSDAKKKLAEHGLISDNLEKDTDGQILGHYIELLEIQQGT